MSKANLKVSGTFGGGGGGSFGGGAGNVLEMNIPGTKVGLIIGKGGETLKAIQVNLKPAFFGLGRTFFFFRTELVFA